MVKCGTEPTGTEMMCRRGIFVDQDPRVKHRTFLWWRKVGKPTPTDAIGQSILSRPCRKGRGASGETFAFFFHRHQHYLALATMTGLCYARKAQ